MLISMTKQALVGGPVKQGASRMLAATRLESSDATPAWFMRQAGRSLPSYRALRQRLSLLDMVRDPAVAAEVTLMPVDLLGVDAAVLFADIVLPLEGLGVAFEIREGVGPVIDEPIRSGEQVARLRVVDPLESTPYLFETIHLVRRSLGDRAALVGFGPSPFTLACYLVEGSGSRDYPHVRALMQGQSSLWEALMRTLTTVLTAYLTAQAHAGAQIVQIFDSWVGVLPGEAYQRQVVPHLQEMFRALDGVVPALYFSTGSTHLMEGIRSTGAPGVSVDWRQGLSQAWSQLGYDHFIQGNLDPALLLAPLPILDAGVRGVLDQAAGRPGHIFNLGHGVLPESDPGRLRHVVDMVHELTSDLRPAAGSSAPG